MIISDVISGVAVLTIIIYCYFRSVYTYWINKNVIGPKPMLLFGNIKESALRRKHIAVLYEQFYNDFPNEKYVGIYRMTSPALLIRDLDIVKRILIKDFEIFPDRGIEFSKTGLGDNLFHCDMITWKALRSHLTPLFTSEKLKCALQLLKQESDKFIKHVESVCLKNQEQEITQLFQKYTIASIMACSFGISINTIEDDKGILEQVHESLFTIPRINEIEFLIPGFLKQTNISFIDKLAVKYCYDVVKLAKLRSNDDLGNKNNIMDILLALQQKGEDNEQVAFKCTDHVIAGQVFIFYAAGYANNTTILSYAMYHLAKNPDIQKKLTVEIDDVLQKYNGEVTYECISELTYLDQVFSETLRLHPTTNALQRNAARNYVVPGTNLKIEKDTIIIISPMAIHHDDKIYPNPSRFDPERFSPENVKSRHSCAYLPFGIGPRSCIATRFAKLQFKVCAVMLLSKFRVEPSTRMKDEYSIHPQRTLLGPAEGIYLNIIPRSY